LSLIIPGAEVDEQVLRMLQIRDEQVLRMLQIRDEQVLCMLPIGILLSNASRAHLSKVGSLGGA